MIIIIITIIHQQSIICKAKLSVFLVSRVNHFHIDQYDRYDWWQKKSFWKIEWRD